MELNIRKEWLRKHLQEDEGADCSAGDLMLRASQATSPVENVKGAEAKAFGMLVHFWRIDQKMSVDRLADVAQVDKDEIESIEAEPGYRPEPRTIRSLASVMRIPEQSLLQLTGNIVQNDPGLWQQSVSFTTNAKRWEQIGKEQRRLLKHYIKYLSER